MVSSGVALNGNGNGNDVNGYRSSSTDPESYEFQSTHVQPEPGTNDGGPSPSRNCIIRGIQNHYNTGLGHARKSDVQVQRELWLVPGLRVVTFNRWVLMSAATIIQFCSGSVYAWSVFNKPIDILIYGEVTNMAPITFYIAIGCLGTSAAIMGPWLERHGPMSTCVIGTCLFFAGNLITALALFLKQIWLVFIGYGVIAGCGFGLCYISPVSALQKWFPDRRGLASGFAVCGFGAGSIAMAKVQIPLIEAVGLPYTFIILGSVYFLLMLCSAIVLRTPPPMSPTESCARTAATSSMSLIEALTSRSYRLMYIMFLANIIFGLVVISRLSNMITDIFGKSSEEASTIVSINGGFNLGGRLVMSTLSDYVGRKNCYVAMLTTQLLILGTFSTITSNETYWAFLLIMWTLSACYGAGFGIIPAFLTDKFGPKNIGACHGIILTAWSIAGVVGGLTFTAVFDRLKSDSADGQGDPYPYYMNVWLIFGVVLIAWICTMFIEPTDNDTRFIKRIRKCALC